MQSKLERRKSQRHRVIKSARLLISPDQISIDAIVRDISATGLRIQLVKEIVLPERFELIFNSERTRQAARLVWQEGLLAGVELTGEKSPIKLRRLV